MKQNLNNFQNSHNFDVFLERYSQEEKCFNALFRLRWPDGFICPKCGHKKSCHLSTRKLRQCYSCHRQTSIIVGTIFESSNLPLTVWFKAIYLLAQTNNGITAMQLHQQLGISYNAAWRIRHKLIQDMNGRNETKPLRDILLKKDDTYLDAERITSKIQTPIVSAA